MNTPNLKFILETILEDQPQQLSKSEKAQFVQAIKQFSHMKDSVYGKGDLVELTDRVRDMINKAEQIATEKGDWFDSLTVKRHMKDLQNAYKVFEATAKEMSALQQRLGAAYDDIGHGLAKYYDVQ
jgi:hypothetical protein